MKILINDIKDVLTFRKCLNDFSLGYAAVLFLLLFIPAIIIYLMIRGFLQ